ncbi:hypothetical protein F1C10_02865 [Sphingomonas sp. NBWT7]|uniref:hypothetical protein n=1 Tax=Sphingomonas sp. NBWT7 TaxID=2596913 RepID=UPI00162AC5FE|nr:hypothetical protein [Sphingomonas sp. NBWT7]QNE31001.1 hypothetical protein F1C10_02865 [Sphingomonas sp. NBWT7]
MTNNDAVTRIDAAIRRIEVALDRRAHHELALRERHHALRLEVAATIVEIDRTTAGAAKDVG